jgi:hypothetical protein
MRQERVQLQKSKYSNTRTFGTLELNEGRISFTLDPEQLADQLGSRFSGNNWKWIEKAHGTDGIKDRLEAGETVQVFDVPVADVEVKKLSIMSSLTGFELKTPQGNWVIVFKQVAHPGGPFVGRAGGGSSDVSGGPRAQSTEWQRAIAESAA